MKILFVDEFEGQQIAFGKNGWFNATQAASRFGRNVHKWLASPGVDAYIQRFAQQEGVKVSGIISKSRQRDHGGYWMHPVLASLFSRQLSDEFHDWLAERISNAQEHGEGIRKALRLDSEYLAACFKYEASTGLLIWHEDRPAAHFMTANKFQRWHEEFAGRIAGYPTANGYLEVCLDGIKLKQHCVVLAMHGIRVPENMEVDHLNGRRADNRIDNLRVVTHAINMKNKSMSPLNTSGVNGVSWHGGKRPWVASGRCDNQAYYIGKYETIGEAEAARMAWQDKMGGFTKRHGKEPCKSRSIHG